VDARIKQRASLAGAVSAALAASACCIGPLLFALAGIGGAGFLIALEPYRPVLTVATLGMLGVGFYFTYRRPIPSSGEGLAADCGCERPRTNRTGRALLWVATVLVVLALGFPFVTPYLF